MLVFRFVRHMLSHAVNQLVRDSECHPSPVRPASCPIAHGPFDGLYNDGTVVYVKSAVAGNDVNMMRVKQSRYRPASTRPELPTGVQSLMMATGLRSSLVLLCTLSISLMGAIEFRNEW